MIKSFIDIGGALGYTMEKFIQAVFTDIIHVDLGIVTFLCSTNQTQN